LEPYINQGKTVYAQVTRDILMRLADRIESNLEELALLETHGGKPITQAKEDILASIDVFRYFGSLSLKWNANFAIGSTLRQPIGVVGLITSFNYPFCIDD
jgi:acyl-CoA reductase-like NAD-dependent aldehyde dehydrogenase